MKTNRRRWVQIGDLADLRNIVDGDVSKPANDPAPVDGDASRKTKQVGDEPPKYGGLHQLAVLDFSSGAQPVDFSGFRHGMNNRSMYSKVVADLNDRFGTNIRYGYSTELAAFAPVSPSRGGLGFQRDGGFRIGERAIDELVAPFLSSSTDVAAIATFAVAHEFFHSLLKHPELIDMGSPTPRGYSVKWSEKYHWALEFQVDYLAARYLKLLGLPLEPVIQMFENGDFPEKKTHPPGGARGDCVATAADDEFRAELFSNEIVDCLAFLDSIRIV